MKKFESSKFAAASDSIAEPDSRRPAADRTADEIRESEAHYRKLFNSIDEGFCIVKMIFDANNKPVDYRFLETNPAFERQTGLTEAAGKTARELMPTLEAWWFETFGKVALTGEVARFENYSAPLNRWFDVYATRLGEAASSRVAVVFTDITARKRMEFDLRKREQFISAVNDASPTLTYIFDLQAGANLYINQQVEKLFGYTPDEIKLSGARFTERLIHPDDHAAAARHFAECDEARDGEVLEFEYRFRLKTGEWRWIHSYDTVFRRAPSGKATQIIGVAMDVNEKKLAEAALRDSEERLRLLVESASDYAIFTVTTDNIIDSWNAGAEAVFGYAESEIIGRSGEILFTREDRERNVPREEITTALNEGRAEDERWHVRRDGRRFYASGVMHPLVNGKLEGFVKICRDQTERIQAEKAVRDKEILQKLVGAQEEERRRIARDLHDHLGQQLTALRLKLEAAREACDDQPMRGKLEEIHETAKCIDADVDFLAWELRPAALDDLGLVAALGNYIKEWTRHTGVRAEFYVGNLKNVRLAPETETNLYRITQEALNNIYKHAAARDVSVMLERRGSLVVLIVEDDGAGFEVEDKFIKGKGIGLLGMRERAALVGGKIQIESSPQKGTTVFVRIPIENEIQPQ